MPFKQSLLDLGELCSCSDLSAFTPIIPVEWVESVLHLFVRSSGPPYGFKPA